MIFVVVFYVKGHLMAPQAIVLISSVSEDGVTA